jgi:hypothetical protein
LRLIFFTIAVPIERQLIAVVMWLIRRVCTQSSFQLILMERLCYVIQDAVFYIFATNSTHVSYKLLQRVRHASVRGGITSRNAVPSVHVQTCKGSDRTVKL